MQIILLKDVKKQGKKGEIKTVKDGFGTFLINNGSAVLATNNSLNRLEKENLEKEKEEEKLIEECKKLKNQLEKLSLEFKVKTGSLDRVFGSISPKQIIEKLKELGYEIDKREVKLDNPISSLGTHNVNIELHKKVIATLKVKLSK